ncbi:enoyl-CoA hydratase/isomerase family protein [Cupriavidus sp. NPDC089707]|uniref:enoyl-CoA hydratase/isomerase family protein n=1 Tax=Cupriavidus sp. NPDC089707 TaxID=3363963 RepID=UPI0037F9FDA1
MTITLHHAGDIAVLTVDRPAAHNALNHDMLQTLSQHLDAIAASDVRAVLVVGGGDRAFCAGADIGELRGRTDDEHLAGIALGQGTFSRLAALKVPTMAVIRGAALGGGLELAMACSHRVALPGARLGLPEIKLGLIPGYGGTQRLPRLVGADKALDLILSGRLIPAEEALAIGLVDHLAGDGDAVDIGLALLDSLEAHASLAGQLPAAAHFVREAVRRAATLGLEAGLLAEAELFVQTARTADACEGIAAFLEKRPARFVGR